MIHIYMKFKSPSWTSQNQIYAFSTPAFDFGSKLLAAHESIDYYRTT
jgi:hypothetical protein